MWAVVCWAVAVFGGLFGTILLLLRKKLAVTVFAASLVGFFATVVYNFVLSNGYEIMGGGAAIFTVVIFAVAAFLLVYSLAMQKAGVLT